MMVLIRQLTAKPLTNWVNNLSKPLLTLGAFLLSIEMYKLIEKQKTPRERALELLDEILIGDMEVLSISVDRFKSEDTGKPFIQVVLELTKDV